MSALLGRLPLSLPLWLWPALAQVQIPTDPPTTVAAALLLFLGLILGGLLRTRGDYDSQRELAIAQKELAVAQKERADKLEAANDELRKGLQTALDAIAAQQETAALMRRVLEALPIVEGPDPTPRSSPRGGRGR